jgi:predicted dehydrogenase
VHLFEAFVFRHHPQSRRLAEIVQSGEIGALRHIDAGMSFVIDDRTNIRMIKDLGGGSIYDGGVYPIAFSRFVAGADPVVVQAMMRFDEEAEVDVWASLLLEYPGDVTATLYCGFQGRGGPHAQITGTKGRIVVPAPYHPGRECRFEVTVGGESRTEDFTPGVPPFQPAIQFFQQCILGEAEPSYMADHAAGTLKVVEAAFESVETGRRVEL